MQHITAALFLKGKDIPMNQELLEPILSGLGYERISLNISYIGFYLCRQGDISYNILVVDQQQPPFLNRDGLLHISEQIRDYLTGQNCHTNYFLYILLQQPGQTQSLFRDGENYWVAVPDSGQLYVYENWHPFFQPVRRTLEDLMSQQNAKAPGTDAAPAGTAATRRRTTSAFAQNRFPICSLLLVIINVLVFLVTDFFWAVDWPGLGGLSWQEVIHQHQYYRLITSIFLHSGLDHIFNNMLVLFMLGRYLEQQLRSGAFLTLYFSSGILAGCTSMVYNMMQNNTVASVGASGAIFGLMGGLLVLVLVSHGKGQALDVRQILLMAALSLYSGLTSQDVDNAAHIGGFIGGMLVAALFCCIRHRKERRLH